MQAEQHSPPSEPSTELILSSQRSWWDRMNERAEHLAGSAFIIPAVLVVLLLAIFPLIISLYLSLSRFKFVKGGFQITFVGLANYKKLNQAGGTLALVGLQPYCRKVLDFAGFAQTFPVYETLPEAAIFCERARRPVRSGSDRPA